jgi:lipopolysaccharide export LptBFGC system permease protein LptF
MQKSVDNEIPSEDDSLVYTGLGSKIVNLEKKYDTLAVTKNKNQVNQSTSVSPSMDKDTLESINYNVPPAIKRITSAKDLNQSKLSSDKARAILESKSEKTSVKKATPKRTYDENIAILDSILATNDSKRAALNRSLTHVRFVKNNMTMRNSQLNKLKSEINKFQLERFKKLSYAVTILIMFFIGAPLGSIIKRGGLGIPVLISISFFILFYIISMICEKYTRTDMMDPFVAAWMANFILLPIGIFFMKQARNDARLFDMDFYNIILSKIWGYIFALKSKFMKVKSLN